MLYGVIIAGGCGKRLWPKSRRNLPKYLLKFNNKSLLQQTVDELKAVMPSENILLITNRDHISLLCKNLPRFAKRNIIGEPVSRNTAPAICLAAALINKTDPEGVMFVMPADHIIGGKTALSEVFGFASLIARMKDSILTIGIKPTFAATGYGYIKSGGLYKRLAAGAACKARTPVSYLSPPAVRGEVYKVNRFIEKPTLKKAKVFLKSKDYCWNSGMFIGKASVFLNEFRRYRPDIYRVAERIADRGGSKNPKALINRYYKKFPDISIDYAIMEKTKNSYVIKADILWDDIGSWLSLARHIKRDKEGNVVCGRHIGIDVKDSIIVADEGRLIAAIGIDGFVVAQQGNATLICPKERTEDVKKIVGLLENRRLERYL